MVRTYGLPVAILGFAVLYWVVLPTNRLALDDSCRPAEIPARLSAAIYGSSFWQGQKLAVADELQELAALPAAMERANQSPVSAIESRMTRLSSNEAGGPAAQEQAEAQEQHLRLERMAWLTRCQAVIAQRLAE